MADAEKNIDMVVFGEKLQRMREAMGLSRDQFALKIGVSSQTLRLVEEGRQNLGKAARLAVENMVNSGNSQYIKDQGLIRFISTAVMDNELRDRATKVAKAVGCEVVEAMDILVERRMRGQE